MPPATDDLEARLLEGDRRALARILTHVEDGAARGRAALRRLYPHSARARTIGLTGAPGAGKSTVTNELALEYRRRGKSIGIIAIDPSSPFTQGAILGDRIRMQDLTADPEIFVRSFASRGALGGLAPSTLDAVTVLDAFGKDVILIETVGAGQDEVEIAGTAQTTVVLNTPGAGDDIQAMKAGIMEIADVLAVNKADLPGADTLVGQLEALLTFAPDHDWEPPIVRMVATRGEGIGDLVDACDRHGAFLRESGRLEAADRRRARYQLLALARAQLLAGLMKQAGGEDTLESLVEAVVQRRLDPHSAVDQWLAGEPAG